MDAASRARLRSAMAQRWPWVNDGELGPSAVEAGECDGCGAEARVVATCGPSAERYLGRRCVAARGVGAWCDGHADEAAAAVAWTAALPREADDIARLWWVATGEVRLDPRLRQELVALALVVD